MKTPSREPRLHRGLDELVKAPRSNRVGAVDMCGCDSSINDSQSLRGSSFNFPDSVIMRDRSSYKVDEGC